MLVLGVLVAASIAALTGVFGFRDGRYRRIGLVIGLLFIVAALALVLTGVVG